MGFAVDLGFNFDFGGLGDGLGEFFGALILVVIIVFAVSGLVLIVLYVLYLGTLK